MKRIDKANEYFRNKFNCSPSVFEKYVADAVRIFDKMLK
jgi:hypothetical protein